MSNDKRIFWLDSLRGIGIICVVLAHTNVGNNIICNWCFSFCVPMLFALGGMTLYIEQSKTLVETRELIKKKTINLLWPYMTFSTLSLLFELFRELIAVRSVTSNFVQGVFSTIILEGFHALWFLPCLWAAEVIIILITKRQIMKNLIIKFIVFFGFFVMGNVIAKINTGLAYPQNWISSVVRRILIVEIGRIILAVSFVLLGMIIYELYVKYENKLNKKYCYIALVVLFVNVLLVKVLDFSVDFYYLNIGNPIINLYFMLSNTLCFILIFNSIRIKALEYFGKNSLIIMCTHSPFPIIGLVKIITGDIPNKLAMSLITCLIILLMEVVICEIINKYFRILIKPKNSEVRRIE